MSRLPDRAIIMIPFLLISLALAACVGPAQPKGPSYIIVTQAQDSPVPIRTQAVPPTTTRIPSTTATVTVTLSATPLVGCVTQNSIFVRSGPAATYQETGGLIIGDCITILAYSPDKKWAQFEQGWVLAEYLDFTPTQTINQQLTVAAGATITPTLTLIPTTKK